MTDTTLTAPHAGWYRDPSGTAPYRYWDGARWTSQTMQEPPHAPGAPASPTNHEAPLPSRRSLRTGPQPVQGAARSQQPEQAAYVPLNPLVARPAAEHDTPAQSPASNGYGYGAAAPADPAWRTPDAWVANAPAASPYAVYGSGMPFTAKPTVMPTVRAINRLARNGFALGILSMILALCILAVVASGHLVVVWSVWSIAGLLCSIFGLRKALAWEAQGLVPVGRGRAVAGIVLCGIALLVQGSESGIALASAGQHGFSSLSSPYTSSQTGTSGSIAGSGSTAGAGSSGSYSGAPVVGIPTSTGYVYNQGQAEASIAAAYAATLKSAPSHVSCPATATLAVSESFSCTVTMPGGAVTTAQATVVDDQGHVQLTVH